MGPVSLFDKSFLQSLSLDESVWFDAFFIPVICPILYVETLANLAKAPIKRTAEAEVRIIAEKTPELSGSPCISHQQLATNNLLGDKVPMDGRIPRPGGRYVMSGGEISINYGESPEMKAYGRWQNEQFFEVERHFAAGWRSALKDMDLTEIVEGLAGLGVDGKSCGSLRQAKELAQAVVDGSSNPYERLGMAVRFFNLPRQYHSALIGRWKNLGQPTLSVFAPYAAHVLMVELFFHFSIAAKLISPKRPSNRTDIAYLFYLPFCMMFISNDKLHQRTANLFLRSDQEFVWGPDLKDDLKRLNIHYSALPSEERDQGILHISKHPPVEGGFLTTELWRQFMSDTAFSKRNHANEMDPEKSRELLKRLKGYIEGETVSNPHFHEATSEPVAMSIKRSIPRKKGSWYMVPKDIPESTYE